MAYRPDCYETKGAESADKFVVYSSFSEELTFETHHWKQTNVLEDWKGTHV